MDKFFNVGGKNAETKPEHNEAAKNQSLTEDEFQRHHERFLNDQESFEKKCLDETAEEIVAKGKYL